MSENPTDIPRFIISLSGAIIAYLLAAVPFFLLGLSIRYQSHDAIDALVFILLGALLLYLSLSSMREPVWVATFCDDKARYGRWRKNKIISSYSKIERVSLHRKLRGARYYDRVLVFLKGNEVPIVFPSNPKDYFVGTDLYTWLENKIQLSSSSSDSTVSDNSEEQNDILPSRKEELLKFKWHMMVFGAISVIGWAYVVALFTNTYLPFWYSLLVQYPIVVRQVIFLSANAMGVGGFLGIVILIQVATRRYFERIPDLVFEENEGST